MSAVAAGLAAALSAWGWWEYRRHLRNVAAVTERIHVNGTRGKSSVTRLIAAGIRAGGTRTFAKTTGTEPRMIFPDGREEVIARPGRANIIEQLGVFRRAAEEQCRTIVIECMALQPYIQWVAEHRIVKSTIGVITNVRADHLDVMGPAVEDVARFLCNSMPRGGIVFTAERDLLPVLEGEAARRKTRLVAAREEEVTEGEIRRFSYVEHRENVALALRVAEHCGVKRAAALAGMQACQPDPGVLRVHRIRYFHKEIEFANAFAANDRDSTLMIFRRLGVGSAPGRKNIVIFNSRGDRIQRAEQFADMIAADMGSIDTILLTGDLTGAVINRAIRKGASEEKILDLGDAGEEQVNVVFEAVLDATPEKSLVIGVGNIGGLGHAMVHYFQNRGEEEHEGSPSPARPEIQNS
ncbi:MAG: poly-gamma-glutamate synthase PgsB [Planctomycetes bacterium]|nr:poly-gamma-glutamate synthase PgsB [Planctomycetota bacterium]